MAHDGGANVSRYLDDNLLLTGECVFFVVRLPGFEPKPNRHHFYFLSAGTDTKIKLWDRRRFTTPVTVFHGHEKYGAMNLIFCRKPSHLILISCQRRQMLGSRGRPQARILGLRLVGPHLGFDAAGLCRESQQLMTHPPFFN